MFIGIEFQWNRRHVHIFVQPRETVHHIALLALLESGEGGHGWQAQIPGWRSNQ